MRNHRTTLEVLLRLLGVSNRPNHRLKLLSQLVAQSSSELRVRPIVVIERLRGLLPLQGDVNELALRVAKLDELDLRELLLHLLDESGNATLHPIERRTRVPRELEHHTQGLRRVPSLVSDVKDVLVVGHCISPIPLG